MKHLILLLLLVSCGSPPEIALPPRQEIASREHLPLYRASVPTSWEREDPSPSSPLTDTKLPLTTFWIRENSQAIRITIHNFPSDTLDDRIPPEAQIARWKRQFDTLNPLQTTATPEAHGGFSGLRLEATGPLDDNETTVIGWSFQLAPTHYQHINDRHTRADFTIKASGPPTLMAKHRQQLLTFANSFEIIAPLPGPS